MDKSDVDARTYFDDLSPARCDLLQIAPVTARVVGFLDCRRPFPVGDVPEDFKRRLRQIATEFPVAEIRGPYLCWEVDMPRDFRPRGAALIAIRDRAGKLFIAPTSVVYLVERLGYSPPPEFQAAVLNGVPLDFMV